MFALAMMGGSLATFQRTISANQASWSPDAGLLAHAGPIELYLTISSGVTVQSTSLGTPSLYFSGLQDGSVIRLIKNGTIRGYATDTIAFTTAVDFSGTLENSTLYITNGSGFIYGGLMTGPAYGYYLEVVSRSARTGPLSMARASRQRVEVSGSRHDLLAAAGRCSDLGYVISPCASQRNRARRPRGHLTLHLPVGGVRQSADSPSREGR